VLACCTQSKYNNSFLNKNINIENLNNNNEAIVVFGDQSYINFINIDDIKSSILIESMGSSSNKQNIVKIKSGRYFLDAGLFKRTLRSCLTSSWWFYAMIPVPFAVLSIPLPAGQFIEPVIDNVSVVFYFDVLPGEVLYIGNIDYKSTNCNIILDNYFDNILKELRKDDEGLAKYLKQRLLKINKKPDACNFLIEDISSLNNKEKYNKFYKTCLDQLKALP
jgi:hypothetical protein